MRARTCTRALLSLAIAAVLLAGACSETPVHGFESFYAAMADQSPRALDRLSSSSRAQLEAAAEAQHVTLEDALRAAPIKSTLRSVTEIERDGDTRAVLLVTDALGNTERVTMVLEQGRWRVALSESQ